MITWKRHSPYALTSHCGQYSIAKVSVDGFWHYELWKRPRKVSEEEWDQARIAFDGRRREGAGE